MNKLIVLLAASGCSVGSSSPSANPPPPWGVPISGGNMIVAHDGAHAIIADADRDRVMSVEIATGKTNELALTAGDEPGRLVEDAAGRVHIALRRGGALLTIDSDLHVLARRPVCAEPRGVAVDGDNIDVACSGGELVTLPAAGGAATRTVQLDRDLRDVLVVGGQLYVTRFRTAELLALDASGAVTSRVTPPIVQRPAPEGPGELGSGGSGVPPSVPAVPAVAWKTLALADGTIVMVHQRAVQTILHTTSGGYDGNCGGGPIEDALTVIRPGQAPFAAHAPLVGTLPVDAAVSPDGTTLSIVLAGASEVQQVAVASLATPDDDGCHDHVDSAPIGDALGLPTSVAYAPDGTLLIYYPELPALLVHDATKTKTFALPGTFGYDAGRALFHTQTASRLSCASCHPEARDDGLVWEFDSEGKRRTQSVAGRILDRGPYHWSGDMPDLPTLMDQVFGERMSGGTVTRSQHLSLGPWLDRIPAPQPPTPADPAAVDRGRALFQSSDVGCGTCHSGPLFTNHTVVDVGTGGAFKVPSLVGIGARAPFLHDGCAATLADRFATCGGGDKHGHTSQLSQAQIADLIAYLESL